MNTMSVYNQLFDIALTVLFYIRLRNNSISLTRRILGVLFLAPLIILALPSIPVQPLFRFMFRVLLYFLYLYIGKGISVQHALYYSIIGTACFTVALNILLSTQLRMLLLKVVFKAEISHNSPFVASLFGFIERAIVLIVLWLFMPFDTKRQLSWINWVSIIVVVCCEIYVKRMIYISVSDGSNYLDNEAGTYAVMLQLFLIAFIIAVDRYNISKQQQKAADTQLALDKERLQMLKSKIDTDASVRSLHHDMKNHLIAIRSLVDGLNESDSSLTRRIDDYINNLLDDLKQFEYTINTGNELLDGLISQKLQDGKKQGIRFQVIADCSQLGFINDIDLCTIFGNALDNAIEASSVIKDGSQRLITIKNEVSAGQCILYFINNYEGSIKFSNDLPATQKSSGYHGIGLANLKRTVTRYNGSLHFDITDPGIFKLIIMFPVDRS